MPSSPVIADVRRNATSGIGGRPMLPTEYDLQLSEARYHELREQARLYRLAQAAHPAASSRRGLIDRLRALLRPGPIEMTDRHVSAHAVQRTLLS
jgi:hypothetical protein